MSKLANRRAPSLKKLITSLNISEDQAAEIRRIWSTVAARRSARAAIDAVLQSYGIEYLGVDRRRNVSVYYANTGDTYSATLLFRGDVMSIGCWGDLVEARSIRID